MRPVFIFPLALALFGLTGNAGAQNTAVAAKSPDLFAFENGAYWVQIPDDAVMSRMHASPLNLIDGGIRTDWTGRGPGDRPVVFVLELAERSELNRIAFDAGTLDFDDKAPGNVTVEVSDTGPDDGFVPVLSTKLRMKADNQSFALDPQALPVGRWVRLTILSTHGNDDAALTGFRGYGRQLTTEARLPDVSGRYTGDSGWGTVNLIQTGNQVTGCYTFQQGKVSGRVEGRTLKLDVVEIDINGNPMKKRGFFTLSEDGKLTGIMRTTGPTADYSYPDYYAADRTIDRPNPCE